MANIQLTSATQAILTVKYNGTTLTISDGTSTYARALSSQNMTIDTIGDNDDGRYYDEIMYNIKIWSGGNRNTGTLVCDLEAINEKFVDKTGTHYFYVASGGSITFELSNNGIYDYYAYTNDGAFVQNPIVKDVEFQFGKLNDEIVNDIIYNYYKNNDTNNFQASEPYTDTTLTEVIKAEIDLDKISKLATVELLKTLVFRANARRAHFCTFNTQTGIDRELFDIINIRHPRLRNRFTTMTSKKWVVVDVGLDGSNMQTTITAVELL